MATREEIIEASARNRLADLKLKKFEIEQRLAQIARLLSEQAPLQQQLAAVDTEIVELEPHLPARQPA